MIGMVALFDLGHEGVISGEIGLRLLGMPKMAVGNGPRPPRFVSFAGSAPCTGFRAEAVLPVSHFERVHDRDSLW